MFSREDVQMFLDVQAEKKLSQSDVKEIAREVYRELEKNVVTQVQFKDAVAKMEQRARRKYQIPLVISIISLVISLEVYGIKTLQLFGEKLAGRLIP